MITLSRFSLARESSVTAKPRFDSEAAELTQSFRDDSVREFHGDITEQSPLDHAGDHANDVSLLLQDPAYELEQRTRFIRFPNRGLCSFFNGSFDETV